MRKIGNKDLLRLALAKKAQKEIRGKKMSLNDLLKDLKEERRWYIKETHGR